MRSERNVPFRALIKGYQREIIHQLDLIKSDFSLINRKNRCFFMKIYQIFMFRTWEPWSREGYPLTQRLFFGVKFFIKYLKSSNLISLRHVAFRKRTD